MRKLPLDDWYDVVIFRYLRTVKRWFLEPDLHRYSFKTLAYTAMRSAIWGEKKKQGRRVQTVSLYSEIPGTDGLTYEEIVTEDNLDYINYTGDNEDMQISFNVKLPPRNTRGGTKSDEAKAIESFLDGSWDNMCFSYDSVEDAKKKIKSINSYRRCHNHTKLYDCFRSEDKVYIVRVKEPDTVPSRNLRKKK